MDLNELQNWVKEDWDKASRKKPDPHLQLLYLFEELGEMSEAIRKLGGHKERKNMEIDLEGEFGDVLIALSTLANHYGIDLNSSVGKCQKKIAERHKKGLDL
jgi:NTP pyrophosphatase (non-canonical NTP hydrolase)